MQSLCYLRLCFPCHRQNTHGPRLPHPVTLTFRTICKHWWKLWCFCLVTLPIPHSRRIKTSLERAACSNAGYDMRRKTEKVVFRFTNRDQGWEENFGLKGMLLAIWWYFLSSSHQYASLHFMQLSRGWFPPKTRCNWRNLSNRIIWCQVSKR